MADIDCYSEIFWLGLNESEGKTTYNAAKGPRNTVYPDMKVKNPGALERISQGHKAHPPMMAQIICPLRILI
jgi:hypothetical protein